MSKYKYSDGNKISLYRLINKDPEWAVSFIEKLKKKNKALEKQLESLGEIKDETSELLAAERIKKIKLEAENKALKESRDSHWEVVRWEKIRLKEKETNGEYEEWKSEMMKWKKSDLIDEFIRPQIKERDKMEERLNEFELENKALIENQFKILSLNTQYVLDKKNLKQIRDELVRELKNLTSSTSLDELRYGETVSAEIVINKAETSKEEETK